MQHNENNTLDCLLLTPYSLLLLIFLGPNDEVIG